MDSCNQTEKRKSNRVDSVECDFEKKKFKEANENDEDFHCDEDWAQDSDFENFCKEIFGLYSLIYLFIFFFCQNLMKKT